MSSLVSITFIERVVEIRAGGGGREMRREPKGCARATTLDGAFSDNSNVDMLRFDSGFGVAECLLRSSMPARCQHLLVLVLVRFTGTIQPGILTVEKKGKKDVFLEVRTPGVRDRCGA